MQNTKDFTIEVHPHAVRLSYQRLLLNSILAKWRRKYKQRIKLKSNTHTTLQFHFFDENDEEIKL